MRQNLIAVTASVAKSTQLLPVLVIFHSDEIPPFLCVYCRFENSPIKECDFMDI